MLQSCRYITWATLFVVLATTGCAEISKKTGVENRWRDQNLVLHEGVTTQQEVLAQLGPPSQIIALPAKREPLIILEKIFMYHNIFLVSLLFMLIFIPSCTRMHISNDKEIDTASTRAIQHNTPYAEVLVALGPPAKLTVLPSGFAFLYESTQALLRSIALSVHFLSVGVTKGDRVLDTYVVLFDERGLVVGHEK